MIQTKAINNLLLPLFGYERPRNKLHILLIILIHIICWSMVFFLPVLLYPVRFNNKWLFKTELLDKGLLIGIFYFNYYWLIPRYFQKKRFAIYCSWVIILFAGYFLQQVIIRHQMMKQANGPFFIYRFNPAPGTRDSLFKNVAMRVKGHGITHSSGEMGVTDFVTAVDRDDTASNLIPAPPFPGREPILFGIPRGVFYMSLNNSISSFSLLLLIGGFISLAYSFLKNQHEKKALENANLNAEINFLRSQINPHFLFNTLNSIYSQAHARSVNTEFSILKLSELLRYVLYDSAEERVELGKDIQYINNYIDLQRLRLSPKITLNYSVTGNDLSNKSIAPLLLINFIENAFKHGISYTNASTIEISIKVFEETLTLSVINPIVEKDSFGPGGLGLKNVTRRLELLYPGQHELKIDSENELHIVTLKLNLVNA